MPAAETQRELEDEFQKRRHADSPLVGDGLDHEIRAVADVGGRAKEHRAETDGEQARRVLMQQLRDFLRAGHAEKRIQKTEIRRRVCQARWTKCPCPEKNSRARAGRQATNGR